MKSSLALLAMFVFAMGCSRPEVPAPVTSDQKPAQKLRPEPTQEELQRQTVAMSYWYKSPNFSTELPFGRTGKPLEQSLPINFNGDPVDLFVQLGGIVIDEKDAAVRVIDVGSGIHLYFVAVYVLEDDEWKLRYRLKLPISLVDNGITNARIKGLDLVLEYNGSKKKWSKTILLPGAVDYVATG